MRTKDLILILIVILLGYLETVRTKDLIRILIVFRFGYLETRAK